MVPLVGDTSPNAKSDSFTLRWCPPSNITRSHEPLAAFHCHAKVSPIHRRVTPCFSPQISVWTDNVGVPRHLNAADLLPPTEQGFPLSGLGLSCCEAEHLHKKLQYPACWLLE
jgi:hypothetical protein